MSEVKNEQPTSIQYLFEILRVLESTDPQKEESIASAFEFITDHYNITKK